MKRLFLILSILLIIYGISYAEDYRKRANLKLFESFAENNNAAAEVAFGKRLAARILQEYQLAENTRIQRYINLVGGSLALYSERQELQYYFGVIKSEERNSIAVPGGYIFITSGLLKEIDSEDELAAVLAHEIAHICEKHIVEEIGLNAKNDSPLAGLSKLVAASFDPIRLTFTNLVNQAYEILLKRGYHIQDEIEADSYGTILMGLTGYNPQGFLKVLEKINRIDLVNVDAENYHPLYSDRIENIKNKIKDNNLDISAEFIKWRYNKYVN